MSHILAVGGGYRGRVQRDKPRGQMEPIVVHANNLSVPAFQDSCHAVDAQNSATVDRISITRNAYSRSNTAFFETDGVLNMLKACPRPGSWAGSCPWLVLLLLLLARSSSGQTAYLVGSMRQAFEASNSSFNSLGGVLRAQPPYSTIELTEDYNMSPGEFQAADSLRLSQPLLITSSPGDQHQLSFAFLVRPQSNSSCCPGC